MECSNINFLAIFVAAIVSFALGSLWYSPLMFGKGWQKALGLSDEKIKEANMVVIFGTSFILMFIMALGLAFLLQGNSTTWMTGLWYGLFVGVFFVATSYGVNLLFQRKSFKLWLIDAGYQIVLLCIMGAIIGAW